MSARGNAAAINRWDRPFYPVVARLWSMVFLAVLLALILAPGILADFILAAGALLGVAGNVAAADGDLARPLAIAYMAVVTFLADRGARRPEDETQYRALIVAKLTSALALASLAPEHGAIWALLGAGDLFVAATLRLARQVDPPAGPIPGLGASVAMKAPRYEAWFGKVDLGPGRAFWFRYALLDARRRRAEVWGVLFDQDESGAPRLRSAVETFDLSELDTGPPGVFKLANASLDAGRAAGRAGALAWELRFSGSGRSLCHVPAGLRILTAGRNHAWSPRLDARAGGVIHVGNAGDGTRGQDGEEIAFEDAPAMLGHHWGRRLAESWAWCHCNRFDGGEDAAFEGLSARVKVAGLTTPPLSGFVLHLDDRVFDFRSTLRAAFAGTAWTPEDWRFEAHAGGATIRGEVRAAGPERTATVAYEDCDGSRLYCRNSKLSTLRLRLRVPSEGIDRTLTATGHAAYEWADRRRPEGPVLEPPL